MAGWGFTCCLPLNICCGWPVRRILALYAQLFGIVDLLSVLPTHIALLFPRNPALIDVRVLRLIRVFRVFKLTAYMSEIPALGYALKASAQDSGIPCRWC